MFATSTSSIVKMTMLRPVYFRADLAVYLHPLRWQARYNSLLFLSLAKLIDAPSLNTAPVNIPQGQELAKNLTSSHPIYHQSWIRTRTTLSSVLNVWVLLLAFSITTTMPRVAGLSKFMIFYVRISPWRQSFNFSAFVTSARIAIYHV